MCDGYERCIHDNLVLRYVVDRVRRTITIATEFDGDAQHEFTDVVFKDVVAYHFEHDSFELGTILFSITDRPGRDAVGWAEQLFEDGRPFGWPASWNTSLEDSRRYLDANGVRAFEVTSSVGLCGWVLAGSMDLVASSAGEP